jgi:hypothetical protein
MASLLMAKSRALSSLLFPSSSWAEGRLEVKKSSSLHAKTPDASSGGAELVCQCDIGEEKGVTDLKRRAKEGVAREMNSKSGYALRLNSPASFFRTNTSPVAPVSRRRKHPTRSGHR